MNLTRKSTFKKGALRDQDTTKGPGFMNSNLDFLVVWKGKNYILFMC